MDPKSPIYPALSSQFPTTKWFAFDSTGQFRPLFRRTNPWSKLGLTEENQGQSFISSLGKDLLDDTVDIQQVLIQAAQSHVESNGERSFAKLAEALIEMDGVGLSSSDIVLVLLENSVGSGSIKEKLKNTKHLSTTLPTTDRRKRNVASMMNLLVSTGGAMLTIDSVQKWVAVDTNVLRQIAGVKESPSDLPRTEGSLSTGLIEDSAILEVEIQPASKSSKKSRGISAFRSASSDVGSIFIPGHIKYSAPSDPELASLRLERANRVHAELVAFLAGRLQKMGYTPIEDPGTFDLAVTSPHSIIFEVKSVHATNTTSQIRKAVSQLFEYRWIHREFFDTPPMLAIVVNQNPGRDLLPGYIEFLSHDLNIQVFWIENQDLVNADGETLEETLKA
jgi:hypothetical protein